MNNIKSLLAEAEKQLQENANQINQLTAMRDSAIAYGNKLIGRIEAYNELIKQCEEDEDD